MGIDDRTAICIAPDRIGEVMGSGSVTIFCKDDQTNYSTMSSGKYTIENLRTEILTKGWKYNFTEKEISFIPPSAKDVSVDSEIQFPLTDFYLTGSNDVSAQLTTNLASFLSEVNSSNVVVVSHPGFNEKLAEVTNYLSDHSYVFSVINLTASNINDNTEADKIDNATCFVFAGDSLNVLSYFNQTASLISDAFYNSINNRKPIFFFGNSGKISGEKFIDKTDTDEYAAYRGRMTIKDGLSVFGELFFQPLIYDDPGFHENRMSSVLWGMMRNRKRLGIYLNGLDMLKISSLDKSISGNVSIPYMIVDAGETTKVDSSTYRANNSVGPRQVAAMNNVRISLTNYRGIKYLLEIGRFDNITKLDENISNSLPGEFTLYQNYPNPFNPATTIKFSIQTSPHASLYQGERESEGLLVSLKIYDILGREVQTLVDKQMSSGTYKVDFHASKLPSGIYFYRLQAGKFYVTKKMILLH